MLLADAGVRVVETLKRGTEDIQFTPECLFLYSQLRDEGTPAGRVFSGKQIARGDAQSLKSDRYVRDVDERDTALGNKFVFGGGNGASVMLGEPSDAEQQEGERYHAHEQGDVCGAL